MGSCLKSHTGIFKELWSGWRAVKLALALRIRFYVIIIVYIYITVLNTDESNILQLDTESSTQVASPVTTDGAKNEKTLIKIPTFNEKSLHARCFMHIISYSYSHNAYPVISVLCPHLIGIRIPLSYLPVRCSDFMYNCSCGWG